MCFGPTASFTSGAVLIALGVATLGKVRIKNELMYAAFPLLFGLHQINEGLLWISFNQPLFPQAQELLTLIFLIVALFLWPIYGPISVYLLEQDTGRRRLMRPFLLLGVFVGVFLLTNLLFGDRSASIINCSIYYDFSLRASEVILTLMYVIAVFGTALFSTRPAIVLIGAVNIVGCGLAAFIYYKNFISVWCFVASILSIMIYSFFRGLPENRTPEEMLPKPQK